MQTFLPYSSFVESAQCLDNKRLGKQRLECFQIWKTITGKSEAWKNHPAVKMWVGYDVVLQLYYDRIVNEWIKRGFKHNFDKFRGIEEIKYPLQTKYPWWMNNKDIIEKINKSHRSNLLRKDWVYYSQFDWTEPDNLEYYWPTKNEPSNAE